MTTCQLSQLAKDRPDRYFGVMSMYPGRMYLVGGGEPDVEPWEEARQRQGAARGRVRFAPGDLADALRSLDEGVIRPAAGLAHVPIDCPDDSPPGVHRLAAEIRRRFDPNGVLAP